MKLWRRVVSLDGTCVSVSGSWTGDTRCFGITGPGSGWMGRTERWGTDTQLRIGGALVVPADPSANPGPSTDSLIQTFEKRGPRHTRFYKFHG